MPKDICVLSCGFASKATYVTWTTECNIHSTCNSQWTQQSVLTPCQLTLTLCESTTVSIREVIVVKYRTLKKRLKKTHQIQFKGLMFSHNLQEQHGFKVNLFNLSMDSDCLTLISRCQCPTHCPWQMGMFSVMWWWFTVISQQTPELVITNGESFHSVGLTWTWNPVWRHIMDIRIPDRASVRNVAVCSVMAVH